MQALLTAVGDVATSATFSWQKTKTWTEKRKMGSYSTKLPTTWLKMVSVEACITVDHLIAIVGQRRKEAEGIYEEAKDVVALPEQEARSKVSIIRDFAIHKTPAQTRGFK